MPEIPRVHLDVELERRGEHLCGTVDDGSGHVLAFSGWLELMSAFDTALARTGADDTGGAACRS